MLQYLFVILDASAHSFCYYQHPTTKSELIDLQRLKDVVFYAQKENLTVNFLLGDKKLPKEYLDVMDTINHVVISSNNTETDNHESILVIDYKDNTHVLELNETENLIVRIKKKHLSKLASIVNKIHIIRRLSVVLLDIESYADADFEEYKKQLENIRETYLANLNMQSGIELNILSDRLVLTNMNNCEAGVKHITFAPNGKFYICPGFYFDDENDSIGDLASGINIKNQQLYKLEYAPICRTCDAFQCKRCVYLNRKITLEVNTPSHEQCVVSHLERNCTKDLLDKARNAIPELAEKEITEIDYLDPFDKIS